MNFEGEPMTVSLHEYRGGFLKIWLTKWSYRL